MSISCPIECINTACPSPSFVETHGTWVLSLVGMIGVCFAGLLTYFLKSRCKMIRCFGMQCDREVISIDAKDAVVKSNV